jgi:hypothetical protein
LVAAAPGLKTAQKSARQTSRESLASSMSHFATSLRRCGASTCDDIARHGQGREIFSEAEHLESLGAFRSGQLLRIVLGTGRYLFPERRIGCFEAGCEADFLVLRDPLTDIKALRSIEARIKVGRQMPGPAN